MAEANIRINPDNTVTATLSDGKSYVLREPRAKDMDGLSQDLIKIKHTDQVQNPRLSVQHQRRIQERENRPYRPNQRIGRRLSHTAGRTIRRRRHRQKRPSAVYPYRAGRNRRRAADRGAAHHPRIGRRPQLHLFRRQRLRRRARLLHRQENGAEKRSAGQ